MLLRRPIRSDRAPNRGCMHMKRNMQAVMIWVAVRIDMPAVLTRYFCM